MRRPYLFVREVFAFLLLLAADCYAAGQTKPLRVAMWGEYMPLHGFVGDRAIGLEAELAYTLGAYLNREVRFVDPRKKGMSSIEAVARGEADIAINAITPTPEREKLVAFTKPYLTMPYRVMRWSYDWIDDCRILASKRVVAPEGPAFSALQAVIGDKAVSAPSLQAAMDLLTANKVDFIFGEEAGLVALGRDRQVDLMLSVCPLGSAQFSIAAPKSEVTIYNNALDALQSTISELVRWWAPKLPEDAEELSLSDMPWGAPETIAAVKESCKQAAESMGLDLPLPCGARRVSACSPQTAGDAGVKCDETLKRAQTAWRSAWPAVMRVGREENSNRYAHTLYSPDIDDLRSMGAGPSLCSAGQERVIVEEPRRVSESRSMRCRLAEGSEWTAHTRTGLVRARLDSRRLEPFENCGDLDTTAVAYFTADTPEEILFISSLPLRPGKSEYIPAEKQKMEESAVPEPVRQYFRKSAPGLREKAWHAYRVPGSTGEAIAVVDAQQPGENDPGRKGLIAIVHWTSGGVVEVLHRANYSPDADEYCGIPQLDVEGFFDFDGDGDLDVLINNQNPTADGLSLLLRVEGGYRPLVFTDGPPCTC